MLHSIQAVNEISFHARQREEMLRNALIMVSERFSKQNLPRISPEFVRKQKKIRFNH